MEVLIKVAGRAMFLMNGYLLCFYHVHTLKEKREKQEKKKKKKHFYGHYTGQDYIINHRL